MPCELCQVFIDEPERVLYEDEYVFVLINNVGLKPGHIMVLPKRHADDLADLSAEEAKAFVDCVDKAMRVIEANYEDAPISFLNGWKYRTQKHLHMHVLPSKNSLRGLFVKAEGCPERSLISQADQLEMISKLKPAFQKI